MRQDRYRPSGGHDINVGIEHAEPDALVGCVLPDARAHQIGAYNDPESKLGRRKHAQQQLDERAARFEATILRRSTVSGGPSP